MTEEISPAPSPGTGELLSDGKVTLLCGDCRDAIKTLPDNSIDAVVTDPPYALVSIGKRFGSENAAPAKAGTVYARASSGFMGRTWDTGEVAFAVEFWAEVYRVLKPGGHVVAFGGTRTYHRMACAIEDAGFEIRDQLQWLYGVGFPKSHDVSKGIDKAAGARGETFYSGPNHKNEVYGEGMGGGRTLAPYAPATDAARQWSGWGTALKPANEPIVLARKPLSEGTVAANVLRWGTGALNIDATRIDTDADDPNKRRATGEGYSGPNGMFVGASKRPATLSTGRWPANVVHDGSDEVTALFPNSKSTPRTPSPTHHTGRVTTFQRGSETSDYCDEGSAARFFYSAKASKADRAGSKHPTVKPIKLMQWLVRLITPPGGVVLDPFAGSGSTGAAAVAEGVRAILIEREAEYQSDIRRRFGGLPEPVEAAPEPEPAPPVVDPEPEPEPPPPPVTVAIRIPGSLKVMEFATEADVIAVLEAA
jgi:DNA modification methylase